MKVLIADDEELIRFDLKALLEDLLESPQVMEAKNGREMIALCRKHRPELAFVDIKMPGIDGMEAIETLDPLHSDTLFVILSGFGEFRFAQQAIRLGVSEYLLKPADSGEVKGFLQEHFSDKLRRENRNTPENDSIEGESCQNKSQITVLQAERIIRSRFQESIGVGDVAEELHITSNYLSSQFKRWMGISFTEFITDLRLEKSRELLLMPGARVSEVSRSLGYNSSRHFAKLFMEKNGMTPSEYILQQG